MKKILCFSFFLLISFLGFSQDMIQNVSVSIFTKDLAGVRVKINDFLAKQSNIILLRYEDGAGEYGRGNKKISLQLSANTEGSRLLESQFAEWGYVDKRQVSTVSNAFEIEKQEMELNFVQKRLATYEAELKSTPKDNPNYKEYFAEVRNLENQIFTLQKQIKELKNQVRSFSYQIDIEEENSTPQGQDQIRFVNMPGVQYSFLKIENPQEGFSSNAYQGVSLKYMFTKGKSFIEIGAFRSVSAVTADSVAHLKELFIYSFGQDFYPTHFGRGSRRFLNLYTGYTVGGIFATSKNNSHHIVYIQPRFGIELFKSRSVLLDTNMGYFIPFYRNLNLRGLMFHASFNFLF